MAATTANPQPTVPNQTRNQKCNHEQQAQDAGIDPEKDKYRYQHRAVAAVHGNGHGASVTNQVSATLTAGPDGALWVTVDGADVRQLAARISAVCDVLIPAQPPR